MPYHRRRRSSSFSFGVVVGFFAGIAVMLILMYAGNTYH